MGGSSDSEESDSDSYESDSDEEDDAPEGKTAADQAPVDQVWSRWNPVVSHREQAWASELATYSNSLSNHGVESTGSSWYESGSDQDRLRCSVLCDLGLTSVGALLTLTFKC